MISPLSSHRYHQLLYVIFLCLWWLLPAPQGLSIQAWHLLGIFLALIAGAITKPLPSMGALALTGVLIAVITKTLPLETSLKTFGSPIVWLIVFAFFIARGFIKTGLGARIAYHLIRLLGKNTLGLAYGFTIAEGFLAPCIPSNAARGGGVLFPIVQAINAHFKSTNKTPQSRKRLGAFLMATCYHNNMTTSALFLTAMAANPLIAQIASDQGMPLDSWGYWFMAASVPGLITLFLTPFVIYKLMPPTLKNTPEAPALATEKLIDMGPLSRPEKTMLGTFCILLVLWVFGNNFGIPAAATALLGLCILLITNVLTWDEITEEKAAWNTFLWFAPFLMMTSALSQLGLITWVQQSTQPLLMGISWPVALAIAVVIQLYIHYGMASITAHVSALYAPLLVVVMGAGAPKGLSVLLLAFTAILSGSLTHFSTGSAPIYYGAGFLTTKEWWKISFIVCTLNVLIYSTIGSLWWFLLGLW